MRGEGRMEFSFEGIGQVAATFAAAAAFSAF
jgi:hypothetical protein